MNALEAVELSIGAVVRSVSAINQWAGRRKLKGIQQLGHPRIHLYLRVLGAGRSWQNAGKSTARNADFPGCIAQPLADWQRQANSIFRIMPPAALLSGRVAVFGG